MDLAAASCCTIDSAICFGKCGSVSFVFVQFVFAKRVRAKLDFEREQRYPCASLKPWRAQAKKNVPPQTLLTTSWEIIRLVGKQTD